MDIDGHKLKHIILICIGWIIIQNVLAWVFTFMGLTLVSDGKDKIACDLIFAFIQRFFIYIFPIAIMIVSTFIWMFQYERRAFWITIVLMIVGIVSAVIFHEYWTKVVLTPNKETAKLIAVEYC